MTETGPGWTMHLGDCLCPTTGLASLADKSVDHVITDPPYSERVHRGKGRERRSDQGLVESLDFGHLTTEAQGRLAERFAAATGRWIVVFCDDMNLFRWAQALESAGAEYAVKGTWIKECPMPRMDGTRPAYGSEEIAIAHAARESGRTRWNGGGRTAIYYANPQEGAREHPTQKPLSLLLSLVSDFTDPGELVCDPFAGSCTTGVACIQLGRRFLGWERDPRYFAVGVKRLRAAREQLGLFDRPPKDTAKQIALTGTDK